MSKLTRALAELAKRADAGDEAAVEGIRAYHGSPHSFDKFSSENIGTGEGAQAFGHGLYFAEEEAVAKAYRDALKGRMVTTSDGVTKTYGQHITEVEDAIRAAHPNLNPDNIRAAAKSVVDDNLTDADVEGMGQWEGVYKSGIVANKNAQASKGSMYEVKIDAAAEDFLNWQTPLREQKKLLSALDDQYGDHEIVLQQLGLDIKNETPTGGDLAMALGMTRGGQTAPPRLLTDAGLKGVKYPAAFTRQKSPDKQSFNYVIFDDRLISISKKYGISIPAAAAIAAGTMTPQEAQAGPGSKALAELAKRADAGDEAALQGIRAYHGSPYSFDEFSTSQIGTGEGAQAYGRGLYFAEREGTAQSYRDTLSDSSKFNPKMEGGDPIPRWMSNEIKRDGAESVRSRLNKRLDHIEKIKAGGDYRYVTQNTDANALAVESDSRVDLWKVDDQERAAKNALLQLDRIENGEKIVDVGNMYEVNIAATPDEFIDWDLPLDEQSESVMNALKKTDWYQYAEEGAYNAAERRGDNAYGMDLVRWLEEDGAEDAAQMLKDAGIKGVQYADAQTRFGKGPKTKNYVVFDDKLIDITKKYGVSIPAAAAIAAGTMTPEEAQASTPQAQASEYPSLGGMGVRMPPTAEDEEAMLAPTGGDLMQQANRDFADSIRTQPEPDFLTGVQQSLLSGIMKTAGVADLSADVVSAMAGPLLSAPGAIARYAADRYVPGVNYSAEEMAQGRRETEDYFNYQPRTELGPQYGEQIMQGIGGAIAPYVPAIKKAAGDSYILGAMRQGYDYLGEREKELAKALMDLSPI
jgi:hypothetical protein